MATGEIYVHEGEKSKKIKEDQAPYEKITGGEG